MLDPSLLVEQLGIFAIFLEGLLSFFSPCVLPLVPLYLSYLFTYLINGWVSSNMISLIVFSLIFWL